MNRLAIYVALLACSGTLALANTGPSLSLSVTKNIEVNAPPVNVEPVVTVEPAPCQEVCQDKCTTVMEQACKKVPVVNQECSPSTKFISERKCTKKCVIAPAAATVQITAEPVTAPAAPVVSGSMSASLAVNKGGRKLLAAQSAKKADGILVPIVAAKVAKTAVAVGAAKAVVGGALAAKAVGAAVVGTAVATKVAAGAAVAGAAVDVAANTAAAVQALKPELRCEDVCEDVPVEVHEVVCKDVTVEVEQCEQVPKQVCNKECACIPMKTVTVNLPKHPFLP